MSDNPHFQCPITFEVMEDPVIDHEGNSYEKSAIEEWIRTKGTSPITRNPLRVTDLRPNRSLKNVIVEAQKTPQLEVESLPLPELLAEQERLIRTAESKKAESDPICELLQPNQEERQLQLAMQESLKSAQNLRAGNERNGMGSGGGGVPLSLPRPPSTLLPPPPRTTPTLPPTPPFLLPLLLFLLQNRLTHSLSPLPPPLPPLLSSESQSEDDSCMLQIALMESAHAQQEEEEKRQILRAIQESLK